MRWPFVHEKKSYARKPHAYVWFPGDTHSWQGHHTGFLKKQNGKMHGKRLPVTAIKTALLEDVFANFALLTSCSTTKGDTRQA